MKIVGKSIRDRVALIKWRRERTNSRGKDETEKVTKDHEQNVPQDPSLKLTQSTMPDARTEPGDHDSESVNLSRSPTSSTTCEQLLWIAIVFLLISTDLTIRQICNVDTTILSHNLLLYENRSAYITLS